MHTSKGRWDLPFYPPTEGGFLLGVIMLRIKKVKDGYILYRDDKKGWHSHFANYHKARTCLSFIERGVMPNNEYYIESCKRLLTGEEFNRLKQRQRYRNGQTGRKAYAKIL